MYCKWDLDFRDFYGIIYDCIWWSEVLNSFWSPGHQRDGNSDTSDDMANWSF
jgi:hypothetical protein